MIVSCQPHWLGVENAMISSDNAPVSELRVSKWSRQIVPTEPSVFVSINGVGGSSRGCGPFLRFDSERATLASRSTNRPSARAVGLFMPSALCAAPAAKRPSRCHVGDDRVEQGRSHGSHPQAAAGVEFDEPSSTRLLTRSPLIWRLLSFS